MSVQARKTIALVSALAGALLLAACAGTQEPRSAQVKLGSCGAKLDIRPDVVQIVCNTDDITAVHLKWSSWGKASATASGSATVDLCAYTDCASGDYGSFPIKISASTIVHCSKSKRAYSELHYVFPNGSPFRGVPAVVYTRQFGETVPPKNQTVRLTC